MIETSGLARRRFLKWGASCIGLAACPTWAMGLMPSHERKLSLYNTHTGESLSAPYWADGQYLSDSMSEFNRLMRDHRTNEVAPIDGKLFDLLHALHTRLDGKQAFHLISGFRSSTSNHMLVATTSGVAKGSLHLKGQAADIFLPGCELASLREAALTLKSGGVGYYPTSSFVHVDIGRIRAW